MQNTFSLKANAFFVKCLLLLCLFIYAAITWYSISIIGSTSGSRFLVIVPPLIIGLLLLLIGYIANKYMSKIVFTISLITLAFSIRLIWILNIPTPIESDFAMMYYSAVQAAKGDFSFAQNTYYTSWVYQLGFTMYQAFIIKLFGESPTLLKILNVAYCTGTTLLVYMITSKVFNEWSGRIAGVIYSLYIPSIIMSSVLTNQHLATFFFYLGFYILITKGLSHKYMWIFIGIFLSLGDIIRPLGALILIAVTIYTFLQGILGKSKQSVFHSIKKLVGIFIIFYLVHYIISYILISTGVTQYPLSNRDPLLIKYERYIYVTTLLFGILSLLYLIITKQNETPYTLFLLLIIGYVAIHFLIEYQTRYRYFIVPSFTIIQSYGLYICHILITKRNSIQGLK